MDRLRFELLQGGSGGDGHRHPEDANDGDEDGERSEDEEMPDRTTEPGPSEQPPETGHPNEGSQTDDEFTVMDVDEEQPEHEASQPPRKRGRFENERSDSMSQGEGASQEHHEGEEQMTKAQRKRERQSGRRARHGSLEMIDFRRRRADQPY